MAQVNFNDINTNHNSSSTTTGDKTRVGFFNLPNDGDEAIVRFMHDSTDTFDILTIHPVTLDGKFRNVNCIRDPREPMDNCPLCKSGAKVAQKIFIHIMQYTKDANGNVVAEPKVWERTLGYASTLKSYIDNYGPLSNVMCKIIRHGAHGDMKTTYEIVPNLSKEIYRDDMYPKHAELFEGYKALGTVVLNKDFQALNTFAQTGKFPVTQGTQAPAPTPTPAPAYAPTPTPQPAYAPTPAPTPTPTYNTTAPVPPYTVGDSTTGRAPWEQDTPFNSTPQTGGGVQRPTRVY